METVYTRGGNSSTRLLRVELEPVFEFPRWLLRTKVAYARVLGPVTSLLDKQSCRGCAYISSSSDPIRHHGVIFVDIVRTVDQCTLYERGCYTP